MDRIASRIREEVVIQKGSTAVATKHAESIAYPTNEQMESYFRRARIVVGHAGAGTIINALSHGKPVVVMPRLVS